MKRSDIALVVLIASVSVMIAFVVASNIPILQQSKGSTKARTIEKIDSKVDDPDAKVFNQDAINPTVETVIGGGAGSATAPTSQQPVKQSSTSSTSQATPQDSADSTNDTVDTNASTQEDTQE